MKTPTKKVNRTTFNFYSKELFEELENTLGDAFKKLPKRIQTGYANVVSKHHNIIKSNQHSKDPKSFFMGKAEIESCFNDSRDFRAVNDNGYYLAPSKKEKGAFTLSRAPTEDSTYYEPTNWLLSTVMAANGVKGKSGRSNGFKLSDTLQTIADKVLDNEFTELTFINHKQQSLNQLVEENGGSLFATQSNNHSIANINLEVKINPGSLEEHKDQLIEIYREVWKLEEEEDRKKVGEMLRGIERRLIAGRWEEEGASQEFTIGGVKYNSLPLYTKSLINSELTREALQQRFNEIDRLQILAKNKQPPSIPILYTEATTGRYTAKEGRLQSYNKSVRYAALRGCYEYDLEAAHQNILLQIIYPLLDSNLSEEETASLDAIYNYTRYKDDTRLNLLIDIDCGDIGLIKEALQAVTYGAHLIDNPFQAITNIFNNDKDIIDRFNNHLFIQRYKAGFNLAHKVLVGNAKEITNEVGITKPRESKSKNLAHILQGYERLILDVIIEHSNREDIALLLHDCVVFYNKQSKDELSRVVKEETGLELEFSEEEY
jgi:hypothetical protein